MIRKLLSGKFRLYSRSKSAKTGKRKVLGTFNTRIDALKRERQIQYFKHRKNPNKGKKWADEKYFDLLKEAIKSPRIYKIINFISYVNNGPICDDCEQSYYGCMCEYCEDCKFQRCLCDLKEELLKLPSEIKIIDDKMRKYIWQLAKETLSREQFRKLQSEFHNKKDRIY